MANGINNSKSMLALNIGPNGVSFEDNFKKAVQKKMAEAREERERQATGKQPGDDFEYVVANNNDNPNDNVNDNLTPEWQKVEQPTEPAANTEGTVADLPYEKVKDNTRQKPEFITPDKPAEDGKYIERTSANERLNQMVPWREDTKDNVMVSRILEHDKEKDADRLSGNVTDMAINVADSMAEKIAEAGISERTNIAANPFYATDPTAMSGAVAESAVKTSNDYWKQLTPEAVGNHVEAALKQIPHEEVFDAAYKAGVSTDWYIGNVLAPKIQQGIYNKLLERHVPKGTLEYVASGAFNSIIGQVAEILYMPAEVRQMRAQGRQIAGQREGIAAEMGNLAVGFAADMPIFKGLGQVVGLLKYGGSNKAIGLALDYSRGGLNFGGYNAISALTGAAHQNGKVTGDDMLRTAEEAGKGFVMGTAMGVAGSKLQKGIAGWGQKNGIGLGVKIGTKVAHLANNTAVMATADMLMNPDTDILSGKDWLEQGKHALMMNVVMDTMHAVEGIAQKPAVPFKARGIDVQAMKNAGIPVRSEKELYAWLTQPGQSKSRLVEDILKNNKLSLAEKNEVYKLVTGEQNDVMPLNPTLDAAVKRTIDGKWVVQESDALGTVNKRQTFESQEEAEAYRESLQPEIMRNNTEYVEAMDNARNEAISMKEAIDVVAKETGADAAKIKLAIRKNGEGMQLTAEEKAWRDEVFSYRDVYKEYATTTREEAIEAVEIANGMEPGTMENVLKKDYKTLNDTEGKAVRDFNGIMRDRLSGKGEAEGVTGAREDLFTPEQRQTSRQKGVELYGNGDHDAMRMQRIRVEQAAERINGVYGADFVNTLDEKGLLAVERLNEQGVELSKEQEGLITDYLNEKTTLETMLENMDSAHKVEIDVARNTVRDMSPSRDEEGNAIVRIAGINGKTYVVRNQVGDSMTLTPVELRADGTIDWSTYNPDNVQSKAWKPGVRYQDVLGSDIMKELAPEYMREYNAIFGERAPEAGMELSMPAESGKMERIKLIGQDAQGNWLASGEMGEYTLADADVRSMIAQTEKAAVEIEKYNERKQQIEAIREELKKHGVEVPETEVQWSRDGYKIDNEGKEVRAGVQETAEKMVEDAEGDAGIALQAVRNKQSKLRAEMDKIRKQHEGETETSKLLEQKKQYEGLNDELEHWNRVEAYYAYKTEAAKEKPLITKERAELMQKFAEKIGSRLSVSDNMYATMLRLYWQTGDKQYLPRDREDANLVNGINLGGNIFINGESVRGLLWAFGHESGHTIAAASRKDYNTYKKAVRTTMGEEAWNKAKEAKRRVGVYGRISDEAIEEEVVNDQIGELFNDPNKFDTFAKLLVDGRAKTGLKTLWDYAKKFAENMSVDGLKEMGAGIKKEWETVTHQFNGAEKLLANTYKKVIEAEENRTAKKKSSNPQIQHSKENDEIFYSNAKKAVEGIKQDKATPEQWLAMLTKQGGIKAGEDKWMGLSDWLKSQDKKSLTREDVMKFIQENQIQIEEQRYEEMPVLENNPILQAYRQEFNAIAEELSAEREKAYKNSEEFEEKMYEKYGYDWFAKITDEENKTWNELVNKFNSIDNTDAGVFDEMVNRHGDDFRMAFHVEGGELEPEIDYPYGVNDAARTLLNIQEKQIDETRLEYTTKGLDNKKEIALTVPTIEGWNKEDAIHFGDAGEGRAIGWIRFGETNTLDSYHKDNPIRVEYVGAEPKTKAEEVAIKDIIANYEGFDNYKVERGKQFASAKAQAMNALIDHMPYTEDKDYYKEVLDAMKNLKESDFSVKYDEGTRVLVIDEIQSKRHQEGREKGYAPKGQTYISLEKKLNDAYLAYTEYRGELMRKYRDMSLIENGGRVSVGGVPEEEANHLKELARKWQDANSEFVNHDKSLIPDAPFDKNWHELCMKRMLRFAAENGYDKLAWTTGEQQAERYDIGKVVDAIEARPYKAQSPTESNGHDLTVHQADGQTREMFVQPDGTLNSDSELFDGKNVAEVFGKDIAKKISETTQGVLRLDGENLRVGAEGMSGFYDKMLPSFMNKYGKKWGAKVEDIHLPNLGDGGLAMHSVDITPEMKESVMQGQAMFSKEGEIGQRRLVEAGMDEDNLAIAKEMREAGKTVDVIKLATGWEIGRDGKWRKEAEDLAFTEEGWDTFFKKPVGAEFLLSDVMEFSKLYVAYPKLLNTKLITYFGGGGAFDEETNTIKIGTMELAAGMENAREVIAHEVQHFIQAEEGFAKGGNPRQPIETLMNKEEKTAYKDVLKTINKIEGDTSELLEQREYLLDMSWRKSEYDLLPDFLASEDKKWQPTIWNIKELNREIDEIKKELKTAREKRDEILRSVAKRNGIEYKGVGTVIGTDGYERLAGEVEARSVQRRVNMTPENRRKVLTRVDEDVPPQEQIVYFSKETDPETLKRLDSEETVKVYRAIRVNDDGTLSSPMAGGGVGGKKKAERAETYQPKFGEWEKADEYPELAAMKDGDEYAHITIDKGNGNGTLDVAYNPYIHTSRQMLNDQFSSAWRRPNLQVMEVEVPVSELTSGYKADKAKNAVGETEWTDGVVAKQLEGDKKRKVILTRWDKPVRIVPTEEYAKAVKEQLAGSKVKGIPFNCVTPEQRDALVKEGINILEPEKKAGADAMKAYEEWKRNATTVQGLDGYTEQDVLDIVRGDIEEIFEDAGIDAKIKGMSLNGSRMRGDARKDSDLDVVVEYEGNYKEDAMFNLLNDQPIMIEGVKVDINPITKGKSGTLEQYMERSREYDEEVKDKTRQPLISDGKPIIKAESDETLVQTHDGGIGVQFSKETYEKRGRALLHEQLEKAVERGYMVEREAQEIRDRMELIYQSISEVADMKNEAGDLLFPLFADIQRMDVKVNTDGQYYLSAIMPNHEYPMNIDFSKSCVKREAMNAVLNALVADSRFDATKMTNKDYFRVKELCKKYGLEIPCYGCYVEASRGRTAEWANKVANDWNKLVDLYNTYGKGAIEKAAQMGAGSGTNGSDKKWFENTMRYILVNMPRNAVKIEPADLISPERSANLLSEHPDVYMAIKKHSAQGTPNLVVPDAIYNGEILAPINEEDNWGIDKAYEIGGVRLQSASDFKPKLFFDYSQVLADIASKKLPAHTYTKVPSYAMLFGKTGMKINLSLFPKAVKGVDPKYAGLDANGGYAWSGESFPVEEAFRIQDMEGYDGNVGTMAVGISDAHIWKLLDDARIKSVIPYHSSHLGAFEAERTGMDAATDYTFRQSDQLPKKLRNDGEGWPEYYKRISRSGETTKSQYGKKLGEYLEWRPDWYEYLRKTKDPIAAGKMFVEECQAHGVIPRFPEFVYREDGSFNENYYKLIQDYTTYDKGGNYVRQRAVTLDMPDNWREVLTDALTKEEKSLVGIGNKLPQIVEEFLNPESDVKFSKEIDGKQMVMQSLLDEAADVKKEGEDLAGLRLRPLEKGETCYVQRRYAENKMFSFTGKEKIESMDDVAYIFKQLEDAAVENSFIVLVKDGQPMVIHTGIGNYNETIVNYQHALAAYQKIKPEQVYFVHNHPSGNLSVSRQDLNVLMKLKDMFGSVVKNGIIINTTTGKYGEFGLEGQLNDRQMPDSAEAEIPIKTYSFSKQVFDPDWNPEKAYKTASSSSIAQFISSHRLGEHKKMNLLVLDSHLKVTGNFFLPWTKISDITSPKTMEAARELSYYVNVAGGTRAALYGNYEYSDAEKDRIKALANRMKLLGTPMLDVLHFDKNAGYHSMGENGEVLFSKEAGEVFDAAVKTFGTTYDIREAGYVLPNGKMLDFSGRHELFGADDSHIKGQRATDHRQISSIAYAYDENGEEIETGIKTTMPEFIRSGAIRLDDNAGYINLSVKPTSQQKEVLRRLVARNDGDVQVEFGDGWDSDHYVEYEGAKPAKVIADIDRYFNEGIKPESDVKFSKEENEFISKYSDNDKKKKIRIANSIKQVSNIRKKAGKEYLLSDEDYVILQSKMKEPVQNFFDATAESIAEDYINEVFGSGKNVIDPDEIRTRAFSVIGYDGTNVALYPQNGELTFRIYKKALEKVANSRKPIVLYLTGNAGAGKSTSLATSDIDVSKASVVWDSPFNTFKSLEKAIEYAKGIGIDEENIKIIAIYNDVITSFNNAIKRAKETGRIAPFTYLFEDTYKKNEGKLTKVNGRYPKIDIICLDNSENKAVGEVSLEDAKKWNYNVSEQDYINGLKILENEINNNTGGLTESQIATLTRGLSNVRGLSDKTRKMARRIAASVSRNLERKDDRKIRRGLEPKENENFIDFAQRVMAEERTGVDTNPTEAQKEAGNYRKGHIRLDGYNITIENPKGSTRSGKDADGKEWSVKMNYDYGYIRGTKGVDGDHIDVYLGPDQENGHVFVVDQIDQKSGKFDEHKVMYGFPDADAAKKAYLSQYEDGWQVGPVTEVTKEEFKKWVDSSIRKTKPFSEYVNIKTEGDILSGEADVNSGGNTLHIGENVISLQPDDVNYVRKQKESLPKSGAWRSDFPQATTLTNKVQSRYPDLYNAAKSGDREAAFELVNKLSESKAVADKIAKLVTDYPDAIVAYPHAEEAAGRNKIPALWAEKLASEGLKVEDDIISITQPMHTGADDEGRLVRRTRFAGEVEKGGKYILLDDQVSSGATLRDMKDYIESRGGEVVQIVGMTASMGGHKIAPSEEHINRLIELGVTDKQLQDYGIAESIKHLTDGEAAKLARLVNRRADRGASQGQEGNGSLGKAEVRRAESQPREGEHWLDYANRVAKEGLAVDSKPTEADKGIKFSKEDTRTENFKRWFGDWEKDPENASKIVDADGKPLVVYHGTPHQFNTFSNFWDMSDNELGSGHYFTNNKKLADSYTEPNFDNQWYIDHQIEKYWAEHPDMDFADVENHVLETAFKDGRTIPAYLNMRNPFIIDSVEIPEEAEHAKENGYDGIVDYGFYERHKEHSTNVTKGTIQYIVFEPNQIKSAIENNGKYDRENPDIRFSKEGKSAEWKKAKEELKDYPFALETLRNLEDQDIYDVAASVLAGGNLLWADKGEGPNRKKGVQSMMGWKEGERKNFLGMFTKDGMTFAQAGEAVEQACREEHIPFDENDPNAGVNALQDVLGSVRTMGELTNYVELRRVDEARAAVQDAQNHQAEERNQYYLRNYGMSYDEYMTYQEESAKAQAGKGISEEAQRDINWLKRRNERQADELQRIQKELDRLHSEELARPLVQMQGKIIEQQKAQLDQTKTELNQLKDATKRKKNYEDAYRQLLEVKGNVANFIREQLAAEDMPFTSKRELNKILATIEKTNTVEQLQDALREVQMVTGRSRVKHLDYELSKLLRLQIQGLNGKRMSVAKTVDDRTRRIIEDIRGRVQDIGISGMEEELDGLMRQRREQRGDINELRTKLKDAEAEERVTLQAKIDEGEKRWQELSEQIQAKADEISEARESKRSRSAEDLTEEINALISKADELAQEGKQLPEADADKITALEGFKILQQAKKSANDVYKLDKGIRDLWKEIYDLRAERDGKDDNERKRLNRLILNRKEKIKANEALLVDAINQQAFDIQEGINMLETLMDEGRNSLKHSLDAALLRRCEMIKNACADVRNKKNQVDFNRGSNPDIKKNPTWKSFINAPVGSFEYMAQRLGQTGKAGKDSWIYQHFVMGKDGVMEAFNTYQRGLREQKDQLNEKVTEIFGTENSKVLHTDAWVRQAEKADKIVYDSGVTIVTEEGEREVLPLSKGAATYLYMVWKMEDGKSKMMLQGFDNTSMQEIQDFIGKDYMQLADWLQDTFLVGTRAKYNARYRELYNTSMARIDNYVPLRVNKDVTRQESDLSEDKNRRVTLEQRAGSLINRTVNNLPVDITKSVFDVIGEHVEQMENWYAYSPVRRDLDAILSNTFFRNQVDANNAGHFKRFYDAAAIATQSYVAPPAEHGDALMAAMTKGLLGGNIAWRAATAIKQLYSASAYLGYTYDPRFLPYLMKNTATGAMGMNLQWCMDNIPSFRARVDLGDIGNVRISERVGDLSGNVAKKLNKYLQNYTAIGMIPNRLIDALTCSMGAKSIYDYKIRQLRLEIEKDKTLTNEQRQEALKEAHRKAVMEADIFYNSTQQSSNPLFMSPMQVSRSLLDRSMTAYQNNNLGYVRKTLDAAYDLIQSAQYQKMKNAYKESYVEDGVPEEEANTMARRQVLKTAGKGLLGLFVMGWLNKYLWDKGSTGFFGFWADPITNDNEQQDNESDDDYKDRMEWESFYNWIGVPARPLQGTPMGNYLKSVSEKRSWNPLLVFNELDDMQKDFEHIMKNDGVFSKELLWAVTNHAMRTGGVNLETLGNIYYGIEQMAIDGGGFNEKMVDLMFALNNPNKGRVDAAKNLYKDEDFITYAQDVAKADKYLVKGTALAHFFPWMKEFNGEGVNGKKLKAEYDKLKKEWEAYHDIDFSKPNVGAETTKIYNEQVKWDDIVEDGMIANLLREVEGVNREWNRLKKEDKESDHAGNEADGYLEINGKEIAQYKLIGKYKKKFAALKRRLNGTTQDETVMDDIRDLRKKFLKEIKDEKFLQDYVEEELE